jgi:hypothetical protein
VVAVVVHQLQEVLQVQMLQAQEEMVHQIQLQDQQ